MLTLTDKAADQIKFLVSGDEIPDDAGVRIASTAEGALALSIATGPAEGDAVVNKDGARVFLEPQADQLLDGHRLDAGVDAEGDVLFSIE